jgi:hypothetical protein
LVGLATIVVDLLFLSYMTLVNKPGREGWVFVCEPRYFSEGLVFILFGAAIAATAPPRFPSPLAKVGAQLAFGLSALFWLASLPAQGRSLRAWEVGGPIDRYLYDRGAFLRVVRGAMPGPGPLVIVEVGHNAMGAGFRRVQAMFLNVPGVLIKPGEKVETSRAIRVLLVADPRQGENESALTEMCWESGGKPFRTSGMEYCEVTLLPSAGPGSPPPRNK